MSCRGILNYKQKPQSVSGIGKLQRESTFLFADSSYIYKKALNFLIIRWSKAI